MPADTVKPTTDFDLDLLIQNYQFPKSYWVWPPEWESSSSVYTLDFVALKIKHDFALDIWYIDTEIDKFFFWSLCKYEV